MRRDGRDEPSAVQTMFRYVGIMLLVSASAAISCDRGDQETNGTGQVDHAASERLPMAASPDPGDPASGRSGIARHQHQPEHGGVVRSVDVYHVEVVADPVAVWLYDRRGDRLPMDDLEGQVVVYSGDQRHPLALQRHGDHLAPIEPFVLPDEGSAFVELTLGKQSIDVAYDLPLDTSSTGDAG